VADFTGNGCLDILQPCERGSLLYRGQSAGLFAPPEACAIMLPHPKGAAFLGDWDADGLFDVCVTAPAGVALWHNYGDGRFVESVMLAGELGYVSKPNAVGGSTCDLNGDGRQDMLILYGDIKPQVFFNRGFRSFGFSISMDTDRLQEIAIARAGQQAGCVADFFGDGTPIMALALADGECLFVRRAALGGEYWLQAAPLTAAPGPVRIWARGAGRDLGAWSAAAGAAPAFICLPEAGPLKVFWQHPDGPVQSRELVLERGLRLALETAGKR
jgi:hypothetical protein